jgi:hypothetical protein
MNRCLPGVPRAFERPHSPDAAVIAARYLIVESL